MRIKGIVMFQLALPTVAAIIIVLLPATIANRSFYGEPCNKTVKCDSAAWLGCYDGTCWCLRPNEMLFDETAAKCVSKAGERCKYALDTRDEDDNLIYEVTSCVQNATCNPDGICTCEPQFHENVTGLCSYSQVHKEPCDKELKCSRYQGLICVDGECKCNSTISVYSAEQRQCVGLAKERCINTKCIANASCDDSENLCRCTAGHFQDTSNTCQRKRGPLQNCTSDDECERKPGMELLCVNGICNCNPTVSKYATAQRAERYRYDPDIFTGFIGTPVTQCVGLVGYKCMDRLCVPRAYCAYSIIQDFTGICKCLPGYKATAQGTCGHDYQEECTTGDSCIEGFVCKDKKCSCTYDDQDYDKVGKFCFSKAAGPCDGGKKRCGVNAKCYFGNEAIGHCGCQDKFVENANGECDVAFGEACDTTSDCDSIAQLQCINSICTCGGFANYSHEDRKCMGLVGARCDGENECTKGAYCMKTHPKLKGICTCMNDFKETSDYKCTQV